MITYDHQEKLWAFINTRLGVPWSSDFRGIGLVKNDCLCAVVAYNTFTGRSCYAHIAIANPAAIDRTFVRECFRYAFDFAGCLYILATATASNQSSVEQNLRLGFKVIGVLPEAAFDESDILLLRMTRNDCRWLNGKQRISPSSSGLRGRSAGAGRVNGADRCRPDGRESPEHQHAMGNHVVDTYH